MAAATENSNSAELLTRFSQREWAAVIDAAQEALPGAPEKRSVPEPGTAQFARFIDHTLLKLDATDEQIDQLCQEAIEHNFKSVCVRLSYVSRAINKLRGSTVDVACVVGFHEGTQSTMEKVTEALKATAAGASELDIVLNHSLLNSQPDRPPYDEIYAELTTIRANIPPPVILKLIFETSQLSRSSIIAACVLAKSARFDFVKTSTGFNGPGATVDDVKLMKAVVGEEMGVKASGGVRSWEGCLKMIEAGAGRIGTSSGVAIMREGELAKKGAGMLKPGGGMTEEDGSDY